MNKTIKKLSVLTLLVMMMTTLVGCSDLFNFNLKPDPLLENITTKDEAIDFVTTTAKEWNNVKAKATVFIVTLPYEGHVDLAARKAYVEKYKTVDGVRQVNEYYYAEDTTVYTYQKNSEGTETYKVNTLSSEFGFTFDMVFSFLNKETVLSELDQITYEKTDYQIKLGFNYTVGGTIYNVELVYKNNAIKVTVENFATITLTKEDSSFFNNLNIDKSLFQ